MILLTHFCMSYDFSGGNQKIDPVIKECRCKHKKKYFRKNQVDCLHNGNYITCLTGTYFSLSKFLHFFPFSLFCKDKQLKMQF